MSSGKLQDLPPEGGYKKIPFARIPAKTYFGGWTMIAGYAGITAIGLYIYTLNYRKVRRNEVEMRSSRHAIMPLLFAERDRAYLKQLKLNRAEEEDLMKNVPGWEVGTWYGEKIYNTVPEDTLINPNFKEYYAHTTAKAFGERANIKLLS